MVKAFVRMSSRDVENLFAAAILDARKMDLSRWAAFIGSGAATISETTATPSSHFSSCDVEPCIKCAYHDGLRSSKIGNKLYITKLVDLIPPE
jgi:hypothetical protein